VKIKQLFSQNLKVINVGIELFSESLKKQGVTAVHVIWKPPAGGDRELAKLLEKIK
jgi:hypothetical protein